MAPRPGLLLFDDPTTGLDPIIASTVDEEIVKLRDLEGVSSIVVTCRVRINSARCRTGCERIAAGSASYRCGRMPCRPAGTDTDMSATWARRTGVGSPARGSSTSSEPTPFWSKM